MIQCSTEVREFELDRHSVLWRSFGGALSGVSGARESVEEGRGGGHSNGDEVEVPAYGNIHFASY